MQWCAFYSDGTRRTSRDWAWADLPHNVVIAVWWDADGVRHLECGDDALVSTGTSIVGVNLPTVGLYEAAIIDSATGALKFGTLMDPHDWARVRALADDCREFPD